MAGTATASGSGTSSGGGAVTVTVIQRGGDGGSTTNSSTGSGTNGAASTLTNGASGSTSGTVSLTQQAFGGRGGDVANVGTAGNGGAATSSLTATNPGGGSLTGSVTAGSGAGGNGSGTGTPGSSGNATATIYLSSTTNTVLASANGSAGAAGTNGAASGVRGLGSASAQATTVGGLSADATGIAAGRVAAGTNATAQSNTSWGVLTSMSLVSNSSNTSTLKAQTVAKAGSGFSVFSNSNNAEIRSNGLPSAADVTTNLTGNPNVTTAYNPPDGNHTPLALGYFGLNTFATTPTATPTMTTTANYSFDITTLTKGSLIVGLLDPTTSGTGFTSLNFTVQREGATVANQTFLSAATATTYFNDHVLNLGALAAGVVGTLDLSISLTMISPDNNTRFSSTLLVADVGLVAQTGDYNNNGTVDASDYVLWRKYNNTATTLPNDSTPGTDASDYTVWRAHFGQPPGSASGATVAISAAVPEPATRCLMLVVASLVLPIHRHRRRRSGFLVV